MCAGGSSPQTPRASASIDTRRPADKASVASSARCRELVSTTGEPPTSTWNGPSSRISMVVAPRFAHAAGNPPDADPEERSVASLGRALKQLGEIGRNRSRSARVRRAGGARVPFGRPILAAGNAGALERSAHIPRTAGVAYPDGRLAYPEGRLAYLGSRFTSPDSRFTDSEGRPTHLTSRP